MSAFRPCNKSFWLAKLCEANYDQLIRLVPNLAEIPGKAIASVHGKPALHLTILERSAFTLTVELTHCFTGSFEAFLEPAVTVRVYLDSKCAEVLRDHERPLVHEALARPGKLCHITDYKWSMNYFLAQWLEHCLRNRYTFLPTSHRDFAAV